MEDQSKKLDARPGVIVLAYWREVTVIEEDADIYEVEYIELKEAA